jgi:hypothetical protein
MTKFTRRAWARRLIASALAVSAALVLGISPAFADDDDDEVVTYGPNACSAVAELPAYANATCVKQERETKRNGVEIENDYTSPDAADRVRLHFEQIFRQNGWTIVKSKVDIEDQEWEYTVTKNGRRVSVEVDTVKPSKGGGSKFSIEEKPTAQVQQ